MVVDSPPTANCWMNEARELSYEMVNCVDADADWIDKMSRIFKPRVKEANGRYDSYKLESVRSRAAVLAIPMVVGDGGRMAASSRQASTATEEDEAKGIRAPWIGCGELLSQARYVRACKWRRMWESEGERWGSRSARWCG